MTREFGQMIGRFVEQTGLSQSEVAKLVGIHQAHLSRMVSGERNAGLYTVEKLIKVLDVPPDEEAKFRLLAVGTPEAEVNRILEGPITVQTHRFTLPSIEIRLKVKR